MRRGFLRLLLAALVLLLVAYVTRTAWLSALGAALVDVAPPAPADAILVLAGDNTGARISKGADLARQGLAPRLYISGPDGVYGNNEADLAIRFAVQRGYPESLFTPLRNQARSTAEEAAMIVPRLRQDGIRNLLIVTSSYHTGRAGRLFRAAAGPDLAIRMVTAEPESEWITGWWTVREGRKVFVNEWMKTVSSWLGI